MKQTTVGTERDRIFIYLDCGGFNCPPYFGRACSHDPQSFFSTRTTHNEWAERLYPFLVEAEYNPHKLVDRYYNASNFDIIAPPQRFNRERG